MATPIREPFLAYVLVHAQMLRRQRVTAPAAAERLEAHAQALDLLAELVRSLPGSVSPGTTLLPAHAPTDGCHLSVRAEPPR